MCSSWLQSAVSLGQYVVVVHGTDTVRTRYRYRTVNQDGDFQQTEQHVAARAGDGEFSRSRTVAQLPVKS